jgi:hypothetical protein
MLHARCLPARPWNAAKASSLGDASVLVLRALAKKKMLINAFESSSPPQTIGGSAPNCPLHRVP